MSRLSDIILEKEGPQLIAEERQRQIAKGYTAEYDQRWKRCQLLRAGTAYLYEIYDSLCREGPTYCHRWPLPLERFHPELDRAQRQIMAGALFQAELDRLKHLGKSSKASENRVKQCGKRATSWLKHQIIWGRQAARAAARAASRP